MPNIPGGWELIVILAVLVVLFGASRLPKAAEGMGKALKIFKREVRDGAKSEEESQQVTAESSTPPAPNGVPQAAQPAETASTTASADQTKQ